MQMCSIYNGKLGQLDFLGDEIDCFQIVNYEDFYASLTEYVTIYKRLFFLA